MLLSKPYLNSEWLQFSAEFLQRVSEEKNGPDSPKNLRNRAYSAVQMLLKSLGVGSLPTPCPLPDFPYRFDPHFAEQGFRMPPE